MQTVDILIDRPLGSAHPDYPSMIYPVNYGFVPSVEGGDGEPQDVYLLGVCVPVQRYTANVIAVVHRADDNETKWVAAPPYVYFTRAEIVKQLAFAERYFHSTIELLPFSVRIADLQPSQLYLSAEKLAKVHAWLDRKNAVCSPVPVCRKNKSMVLTDGHTRVFSLWQNGAKEVSAVWDEDDLDWTVYSTCLDWCAAAQIYTVADLKNRVLSAEDYRTHWIDRCARIRQK